MQVPMILNAKAPEWQPTPNSHLEKKEPQKKVALTGSYQSPISPNRREIPLAGEKLQTSLSHAKSSGKMPLELDTDMSEMDYPFSSPNAVSGVGVFTPYYQATPEAIYHDRLAHACHTYNHKVLESTNIYEQAMTRLNWDAQQHRYTQEIYNQAIADLNQVYQCELDTIEEGRKHEEAIAHQQLLDAQYISQNSPYNTAPMAMTYQPTYQSYAPQSARFSTFGMQPSGAAPPKGIVHHDVIPDRKLTVDEFDSGLFTNTGPSSAKKESHLKKTPTKETLPQPKEKAYLNTPTSGKSAPHHKLSPGLKKSGSEKKAAQPYPNPDRNGLSNLASSAAAGSPLLKAESDINTLPPAITSLVRLTSHGQPITDAMAQNITPATAHIMSQVPANYPDLLRELEISITADGAMGFLSPQGIREMMITINDDIVRSFYSQVTDREGYSSSATPSPTTLLTVFYEARDKQQINGKDHAQKLGIILTKITEVMSKLKIIRDGQKDTPAGKRAADTSKIFLAFFNKIGRVGVEALEIYENELKTNIASVDIPKLKILFNEEAVLNDEVFFFYIKQTNRKKLISQDMTPKKIKFRHRVRATSEQLKTPIKKENNLNRLFANAAVQSGSGKKLSQRERKQLAQDQKATQPQFPEKTKTSLPEEKIERIVPTAQATESIESDVDVLNSSFQEEDLSDIHAAFEDMNFEESK